MYRPCTHLDPRGQKWSVHDFPLRTLSPLISSFDIVTLFNGVVHEALNSLCHTSSLCASQQNPNPNGPHIHLCPLGQEGPFEAIFSHIPLCSTPPPHEN
ncbi:hypothetical protein PMAYCL1PPCAC_30170 [Pristionchus mayeri]|uniref:Uncharacterized protein n=1 Tax=Pristionchus mayeri TaxID=1317129 RepID=A0AAN5DC78_9BILA|nr:hypothetical protein PMAYCL1PPCAC_30170 [Pristionchus mayeri]